MSLSFFKRYIIYITFTVDKFTDFDHKYQNMVEESFLLPYILYHKFIIFSTALSLSEITVILSE